ncbi:MAG: glycine betaine ABC transporter substrate-binding protein [Actinomycetota bacterium]
MKVRGWKLLVAGLAATSLLAAACSDVEEGGGDTGGDTGGTSTTVAQCGTEPINLAVNAWVGAEANAAVAAALMQQEMGCEVELVKIDEFPQFAAMQQGEIDASLEVWPSVHPKDYKQYIDDPNGGVVDGGELGILGNIGWFIPSYVLDEHPEFASYEGIIGNESVFATAETGDKGQFLGSDPNFGFYDEEIAQNLGLDLEFVYSGSETGSLAALDKAAANQDPLLMYFWSPHWAQAKYDLVEVELPPYDGNAECAAALENADADGYACDYADDVLYKALSAQLEEKDPAAFEFLQNFNWTEADQNEVALAIQEKTDPLEAGQAWIDANADVWEAWLPQAS